jgi:hypothetical protein
VWFRDSERPVDSFLRICDCVARVFDVKKVVVVDVDDAVAPKL